MPIKADPSCRAHSLHDSLLSSFSHHSDTLAILSPTDVLYLPSKGLILVLQQVLFLGRVPNTDLTRHIYSPQRESRLMQKCKNCQPKQQGLSQDMPQIALPCLLHSAYLWEFGKMHYVGDMWNKIQSQSLRQDMLSHSVCMYL